MSIRNVLAASVVALAVPAAALAMPYNPPGGFATFTTGGTATATGGAAGVQLGDTLNLGEFMGSPEVPDRVIGGTAEFEALNFMFPVFDLAAPVVDPVGQAGVLPIQLAVGSGNMGQVFSIAYDRSQVMNPPPGNGSGTETGTLTFMITETITAIVNPTASLVAFEAFGTLTVTEIDGSFYDSPVSGSWTLSGTAGLSSDITSFSLSVSVPPDIPIPLPAPALLLLTGLAGLGMMGRKRLAT